MSAQAPKQARLDVRVNVRHKKLIEKAALASGQSVSNFVVSHLLEASRRILEEQQARVLTDRDRKTFLEILDRTEPNEALTQAAARFRQRRGR